MAKNTYNSPIAAAGAGKAPSKINEHLLDALGSAQPDSPTIQPQEATRPTPPRPPVARVAPPVVAQPPVAPRNPAAEEDLAPPVQKKARAKREVRRTARPENGKKIPALHTFEEEVLLMIERVASHKGWAKSKVVNDFMKQVLEQMPESQIKTKWEQ
jgi:hypothetical protein